MKEMIVAAAAAAMLTAIPLMNDCTIQAKPAPRPGAGPAALVPPQVRANAELTAISTRFSVPKETLEQYYNMGWGFKELRQAAFLSYASGKDMASILSLKETNSWPRVEYKLGLTPNAIKKAHETSDALYLKSTLHIDESLSLPLLQQNFSVGDVVHAVLMSQYCGKAPADIIAMHNPPAKDWDAVAADLGITETQMDAIRTQMQAMRP